MDCFITDPQNNVLYNEQKKQYDSFSHTTAMSGVYKICFSNEFSTFTHKTVYLEFRHGDEQPLLQSMTSVTALTQVGPRTERVLCVCCSAGSLNCEPVLSYCAFCFLTSYFYYP